MSCEEEAAVCRVSVWLVLEYVAGVWPECIVMIAMVERESR